jgi:hypothetical protein
VMCMFLNFFKTGYVELNGRMVVNEELERMWKDKSLSIAGYYTIPTVALRDWGKHNKEPQSG